MNSSEGNKVSVLDRIKWRLGDLVGRLTGSVDLSRALLPVFELERVDGRWLSLGNDPQFLLPSPIAQTGWYRISFELEMEYDVQTVKLYFDYGEGFSESESVAVTACSGSECGRLFLVTRAPTQLRLDPMTNRGEFAISRLTISPAAEAREEVISRLVTSHRRFRDRPLTDVAAQVAALADRKEKSQEEVLAQLYDDTFGEAQVSSAPYGKWIERVERRHDLEIEGVLAEGFGVGPKISILVPVYDPDLEHLHEMVRSVFDQSYDNWQLCLVDDASSDPDVRTAIEAYAESESRIVYELRTSNGRIARASNDALALAEGDYCALLDHDDLLHPHALAHIAKTADAHPEAQIIYSDEDKVDGEGSRYDPHFKTDWNRDLLYSHNYISHLGVYRTELLRTIGGFRPGFEGGQDYDLVLRCIEHCADGMIRHVPRVLYHWRATRGSTALAADQKHYAEDAGRKALQGHLDRTGKKVKVATGKLPNTFRCVWELTREPLVSLLIPTKDKPDVLAVCIDSILERTSYPHYEILVLNNQSSEQATYDYLDRISEEPRIAVLDYDLPFNFSAVNNFGAKHARGEVLGLINNDIEAINDDWLVEMLRHALREDIGCVGAKLFYENGTIQHAGVVTGLGGVAGHSHKYYHGDHPGYFSRLQVVQNYSAVTAAAMLVRKRVFDEVGGMRESLPVAFNDVDFCLRVERAGYRNLWTPFAELYHYESTSRGTDEKGESRDRFEAENREMQRLWGDRVARDPYYNPNLTQTLEDFQLEVE